MRTVVVAVATKLDKDGRAALGQYAAWRGRHPDKTLIDWMRIGFSTPTPTPPTRTSRVRRRAGASSRAGSIVRCRCR